MKIRNSEEGDAKHAEQPVFFKVLTEEQVARIRDSAFNILRETGCRIHHKGALQLLQREGADVSGDIVRVPQKLIEACIDSAPKGFWIYDRNGQRTMDVRGRNFYYGTSTSSPNTKDPFSSEIRKTTVADIALGAKVADALPNIDFVMPMGSPQDVPAIAADLHEFYAVVTNTSKPIVFNNYSARGFELVVEMAADAVGGLDSLQERPYVLSYPEPVAPLSFPHESIEKMLVGADLKIPQIPGSTVQPGATSPVTVAGSVAQLVAEGLMSLIVIQLRNPGAPCVLGGNFNVFDMKTTLLSLAAPEMSLGIAAQAEVARSMGLPSWGLAGSTDSKVLDAQAGVESAFSILAQGLAGLNLIHDVGYMDMAMVCSVEMLVLGDEVIGMAKRFIRGFVISEETLAEDVIKKVGPSGHFIQENHTFHNFRKELWMPTLMTRQHYNNWKKDGSKNMEQRVKEKVQIILETHTVPQLAAKVLEALEIKLREGEKELVSTEEGIE
jgi:trimethylamine--corrinoid protein Co-methyltransferase